MNAFRTIYRYWITILFVAVIAQIGGAAYGAFYSADKLNSQSGPDEGRTISETVFDHGFGFHTGFGYLIFLGAVLLLVFALLARLGKRGVLFALAGPFLSPSRSCSPGSAKRSTAWGSCTGSTRSSSSG